jgi:hypothetical protein
MVRLSDDELSIVLNAARPLAVENRDAFLNDVADALGQTPEPGSGALYRICAELQRKHFDPPQLIHVAGAHSKYR